MDRSRPCLRLDIIITPAADITHLWSSFRPVDRAFLWLIIGDLPLLADSPIDRTLLRTAISFWDTQRAVFRFQETELAPTVEEYAALIQWPMPTRDIVIWLYPHIRPFSSSHPFSCIIDERSLIARLLHVFRPSDRNYTDWTQFMEELTPSTVFMDYSLESRRTSLQRRIALHTASCGQTLQLHSQIGFYESERFDVCGAHASFRSSTSQSTRQTTSELSQLLQHMWCSSIRRDSHLFIGYPCHGFRAHITQTFQT
ncbi:hypothetical protein CRG98_032042 [Punica granatum]|uniref:Aminotransferase-like plant mobile domain-containing protein n=1 Tax=Punica granatum TaxID=22663 RepID=A0A2I0IU95_PUNGR|nr:hypothetical protein CRG98_032042 [Punica granatum]